METRDAVDEVNWGSLGHRDYYTRLLAQRVRVGWITALIIGIGALGLLLWAEYFPMRSIAGGAATFAMLVAIFLIIVISFVVLLHHIDEQLRSLEIFFGFYERRSEVRHEIYCTHPFHCLALHYFNSSHKDTSDP